MKPEKIKVGESYIFNHGYNPNDAYNGTICEVIEPLHGMYARVRLHDGLRGAVEANELSPIVTRESILAEYYEKSRKLWEETQEALKEVE